MNLHRQAFVFDNINIFKNINIIKNKINNIFKNSCNFIKNPLTYFNPLFLKFLRILFLENGGVIFLKKKKKNKNFFGVFFFIVKKKNYY